ncbi:MAG: hypothetical protein K2J17_03230, partial [Paramuribaculum sp.]|nr:hypothetical protein [Paramuribaculum sp.]
NQFISDFKSKDMDKMLNAYEWYVNIKTNIRPGVRELNEDAVMAEIALDKAVDEVASPYEMYSLTGVLDDMRDKMNDSQKAKYDKLTSAEPLYFTADDDITAHAEVYRKLRYHSPF